MGDLFRKGDQIFLFPRPLAQSKQKSHFHLTVVYPLKSSFADSNIIKKMEKAWDSWSRSFKSCSSGQ